MAVIEPAAPRVLHFDLADRDQLMRHAVESLPEECCGVLFGRREGDRLRVREVRPAENIAEGDRTRSYQIDWRSLFAAVKEGRRRPDALIGFYHSHPDGSARPSRRDHESTWEGYVYVIVAVDGGTAREITAWWVSKASDELSKVAVVFE